MSDSQNFDTASLISRVNTFPQKLFYKITQNFALGIIMATVIVKIHTHLYLDASLNKIKKNSIMLFLRYSPKYFKLDCYLSNSREIMSY